MVNVFQIVSSTILSILQDTNIGFNATLATVGEAYGVTPFTLDFSGSSTNVFHTRTIPNDVLSTTDTEVQFLLMYGTRAQNQNFEVGQSFSGTVGFELKMILSYPTTDIPSNADQISSAVADTFLNVFDSTQEAVGQMWLENNIVFNNNLDVTLDQVVTGGENWIQPVTVKMQMIVSV